MTINDSNNIVSLIDTIIIYNGDTAYFPQYLAKGEQYSFSKKNDSENYILFLTRNNLTSVSFDITFTTQQNTFHFHGIAELNHGFFFAKGSHEDDTSGISYGVDEYLLEDRNYIYKINPGINAEKKIVADFFIHTLAHAKDSIQNRSYISPTLRLQ